MIKSKEQKQIEPEILVDPLDAEPVSLDSLLNPLGKSKEGDTDELSLRRWNEISKVIIKKFGVLNAVRILSNRECREVILDEHQRLLEYALQQQDLIHFMIFRYKV